MSVFLEGKWRTTIKYHKNKKQKQKKKKKRENLNKATNPFQILYKILSNKYKIKTEKKEGRKQRNPKTWDEKRRSQ